MTDNMKNGEDRGKANSQKKVIGQDKWNQREQEMEKNEMVTETEK